MYDLEEVLERYGLTFEELIELLDAEMCPMEIGEYDELD